MLMNSRSGENTLLLRLDKLIHGFIDAFILQGVALNRETRDIRGGIVNVFYQINSFIPSAQYFAPLKVPSG